MLKSAGCRYDKLLPAALAAENRFPNVAAAVIAGLFFIFFFIFWMNGRELSSLEGLFAACTQEYTPGMPVTAHGVIQRNIQPLFPAATALLVRLGIPLESAMRLLAVLMLAAWSILAGISAARRRNFRAGIVTFSCCAGTIFAMDKGVDGLPVTMTAFFLLAGQLSFFHFGGRLANWNKAWITSVALWILAFLSGGPIILPYIIMPILFLRRPLSVRSKFNTPGFFIACALMALTVLWRAIQAGYDPDVDILPSAVSSWAYLKQVLSFPWIFPIRLFPWSLLIWLPFCAALQAIDPTPVFSKYLRTLFFVSFALTWLLPNRPGIEIFYAVAPLAIMVGLNYDLGIRRYWKWFREALFAGELLIFGIALTIAGVFFLPEAWLERFFHTNIPEFDVSSKITIAPVAITIIIVIALFFHLKRKTAPIWQLITGISISIAIFCNVLLLPGHLNKRRWRDLGNELSNALGTGENVDTLYKWDIDGMYCGLFYAGVPVKKIRSLDELPAGKTVYLISSGFPRHFGWRWTPLLPPEYRFEGERLSMWRGIPAPPEKEDDEELIQ